MPACLEHTIHWCSYTLVLAWATHLAFTCSLGCFSYNPGLACPDFEVCTLTKFLLLIRVVHRNRGDLITDLTDLSLLAGSWDSSSCLRASTTFGPCKSLVNHILYPMAMKYPCNIGSRSVITIYSYYNVGMHIITVLSYFDFWLYWYA